MPEPYPLGEGVVRSATPHYRVCFENSQREGYSQRARMCEVSSETSPSCGLPIGNLTSQFFANLYLSPLDHFVLEQLKPKGYVRYMDDMVIFSDSQAELKMAFMVARNFCCEKMNLLLKEPVFGKTVHGVPFLGWRITRKEIFLLGKTKRRMKSKLHEIQKDYDAGKISEDKMCERAMAVFASRKLHGNQFSCKSEQILEGFIRH